MYVHMCVCVCVCVKYTPHLELSKMWMNISFGSPLSNKKKKKKGGGGVASSTDKIGGAQVALHE